MCSIVDRIKTLVVYLDHEDTFVCVNQDDIVVDPACDLPKVISPIKVVHIDKVHGEELTDFYTTILGQQSAVHNPECGSTSVDDGS